MKPDDKSDIALRLAKLEQEAKELRLELEIQQQPIKVDWSRVELLSLCSLAFVPQRLWSNRDSCSAQKQLGEAFVLLKADCNFVIDLEETDAQHINFNVFAKGFNYFESYAGEKNERLEVNHFYLPTPKRLEENAGRDWY